MRPSASALRRSGRNTGRHASRRRELPRPTHQPSRPGMVATGGARGAPVSVARAERAARGRDQVSDRIREDEIAARSDPWRSVLRQRAVRSRQGLRCHRLRIRRDRCASPTILPSRSTTGARSSTGNRVGALDDDRVDAMVRAYAQVRSPNTEERAAWPVLLRAAALRFWLSRLYDLHLPRARRTDACARSRRVRANTSCARRRDAALSGHRRAVSQATHRISRGATPGRASNG